MGAERGEGSCAANFHRPTGGFVGVANVGLDDNWLGNHLSQANLYGFGRLAWNPESQRRAIAEEWTRQTFGREPRTKNHHRHATPLVAHL